jgi:exodeoxyribonuclease VII small subunit
MAKGKEKEPGFEESLDALEKIVAQLESGELPLERALEIFEDGVGLARRCQSQLEEAERKVEVLLRERGEIKTVPFDTKVENAFCDGDRTSTLTLTKAAALGSALHTDAADDASSDDIIPF